MRKNRSRDASQLAGAVLALLRKDRSRDLSLLPGAVLALFGVFASVMADGPWSAGRLVWIFCIVLAYGLLGLAAGFFSSSRMVVLWMSLPAAMILSIMFNNEGQLWYVGYLAMIVVAAWLGAAAGVHLRARSRRHK